MGKRRGREKENLLMFWRVTHCIGKYIFLNMENNSSLDQIHFFAHANCALRSLIQISSKDVSSVVAKVVCNLFHIFKVLYITLHFLPKQLLKTVSNFPSASLLQEVKVGGSEKFFFKNIFSFCAFLFLTSLWQAHAKN